MPKKAKRKNNLQFGCILFLKKKKKKKENNNKQTLLNMLIFCFQSIGTGII